MCRGEVEGSFLGLLQIMTSLRGPRADTFRNTRYGGQRRQPESESSGSVLLSCSLDCPHVHRPVLLPNQLFSAMVAREKILELLVFGTAAPRPRMRGSEPLPFLGLPGSSLILIPWDYTALWFCPSISPPQSHPH